ncbi:hypothetical protein SCHPADRAFT_886439 [Schizopora paradoxa]|uniref:MYND-type domain-containing protein n=1 Tax=Schizopora paradoxa TaxID=27342 RepID=A0A0H2S2B2_9AGAM|nr:hypothetical protein SCHPADRAFT_886439 [Schizopora paradoxa]
MSCTLGLGALNTPYFSQHSQQFRQCWPDVISWSKAIFRGRKYRNGDDPDFITTFFSAISQVFDVATSIDSGENLVSNEDILHFAVELWKGDDDGALKPMYYATSPLLAYLNQDAGRIKTFCEGSSTDPFLLVQTIIARFDAAVNSTSKTLITMLVILDLAELLFRLSTHHYSTVRRMFIIIETFVLTPNDAILPAMLRFGFLRVLITVAAKSDEYKYGDQSTLILSKLQLALELKGVVSSAVASMGILANRTDFDLPKMLQSTDPKFREEWKRFESRLLEYAVVFELLQQGYAEERGICVSCRKRTFSKELRKCAGCEIALYCSTTCEKDDWFRHKAGCQSVGKESATLAQRRNIPVDYLGVHLRHDCTPHRFEVFDYRRALDEDDSQPLFRKAPIFPLLAKEAMRARVDEKDKSCLLLVVKTVWQVDMPYLVYLENFLPIDDDLETASCTNCLTCLDGEGNIIFPRTDDIVEETMSRFYASPNSDWRARWIDKPFESLARQAAPYATTRVTRHSTIYPDSSIDLQLSLTIENLTDIRGLRLMEQHGTTATVHKRCVKGTESLDNDKICRAVISCTLGIGALGSAYFTQHNQQFHQCWPHVISWYKAIFRGHKYRNGKDFIGTFFFAIAKMFGIAISIDSGQDLLCNEDIFHFAVDLWKGDEDGVLTPTFYATRPLLAYLSENEGQINSFCERSAYDPFLFVQTIIARFDTAVFSTPKGNAKIIADLADLLSRFVKGNVEPVTAVLLWSSNAIPALCRCLDALLDDVPQTEQHDFTIRWVFNVIVSFVTTNTVILPTTLRTGFLRVLITIAANPDKYEDEDQSTSVLSDIQPALALKSVVFAAINSMRILAHKTNFNLPRMLRSANPNFREEWKCFESRLLEHAVTYELLRHGVAKGPLQEIFGNARDAVSCEKDDWVRHKADCESAEKDFGTPLVAAYSRIVRRFATLQVNRFWRSISALAQRQNIPIDYLGVYIHHDCTPYKFEVFDCRRELDDSRAVFRESPTFPLLAKEAIRARVDEGDKSCLMLVVRTIWLNDMPYLVYLDDNLSINDDLETESSIKSTTYLDGDGNILFPRTNDVVEETLSRFYALPNTNWRSRWIDKPFESLARQAAIDFL